MSWTTLLQRTGPNAQTFLDARLNVYGTLKVWVWCC